MTAKAWESTTRMARWPAVLALTTVLAVGCGDTGQGAGLSTENAKDPLPTPAASASDGTDTDACADGDCQIAVTEQVSFPFRAPNGTARLTVNRVDDESFEYTVTRDGGSEVSGGASGAGYGCSTFLDTEAASTVCERAEQLPEQAHGTVMIQLLKGAGSNAVVTIATR
ncbi:hypothetical protein [Nocardiopsis sp. LOL_012]|uniref:hypothetical protein n=1 Tax=Nocardiopsis sp. LOL_012 TaxID=3345409 RepID=UPI003A872B68